MNVPAGGGDLYVSGFNRDLRLDHDDAISIGIASSHSLSFEKSDSSGSPPTKNNVVTAPNTSAYAGGGRRYNTEAPIERDFYRNPTLLSRMILYNKFANANKRCRDHPEEASVWVCAKRKSNVTQVSPFYGMFERSSRIRPASALATRTTATGQQQQQSEKQEYSLRQLPIHIACTSLAFTHENSLRSQLEQLIVRLVVTNPDGCGEFDHGGKLPLHEAIWSNATPETIAMLIMASPKSIDQRDKFGREPMELNYRRMGVNKSKIRDMLNLGVAYWESARQEARLRMKLAVIPPSDKSIASTSVMGTSQRDKESIVTTDTANYNSVPLPKDIQRKPRIEIKSEEIIPIAWEQLERRVILLEQLLAEVYEKNYELGGIVEELKRTKKALTAELEVARATPTTPTTPAQQTIGRSATSSRSTAGKSSSPRVAVVPEDDEMSSVKLMEHTERIEQLESLVGSFNSNARKRRFAGSSRVSELSSFSTHTSPDRGFIRDRTALARNDSLVSGLTASEASFFDTSINAVNHAPLDDDDSSSLVALDTSRQDVAEVLQTDNLSEIFHQGAKILGSGLKYVTDPSPRGSSRGWTPPVAIPSTAAIAPPPSKAHASPAPAPTPTAKVSPPHIDTASSVPSLTPWEAPSPSPMAVDTDSQADSSSSSSRSSRSYFSSSAGSSMEESSDSTRDVGEIQFPGVLMSPETDHVNSTISISATSGSSGTIMSENSTIVTDEKEIYFRGQGATSPAVHESIAEESTAATMSTRGRVERMVFGRAREGSGNDVQADEASDASTRDPARYNYDIRIPALDPFVAETGEI